MCLEHNLDVNKKDTSGMLPHHYAAEGGSYDILTFLLNHKAEQFAGDQKKGLTRILHTTFSENIRKVKKNIGWQRCITAVTKYKRSLLHCAAMSDSVECVALCLNNGLSPDIRDKAKRTPLMLASAYGTPQMVMLLLNSGATLEAKDNEGKTPLFYAIGGLGRRGHRRATRGNIDCISHRLRQLSVKERHGKYRAYLNEPFENTVILLEHGANIHTQNAQGKSAFWNILNPLIVRQKARYLELFIDVEGSSLTRPVRGEILLKRVLTKQPRDIIELFIKRSYRLFAPVLADVQESYERVITFIGVCTYYRNQYHKLGTLTVYPVLYILCSLNETADDLAKIVLHHLSRKDTDPQHDFSHLLSSDARVLLTSEESKTMVVDYIVKRLLALFTEICDEEQGTDSLDDTRRLLLDPLLVSDTFGEVIREGIAQRFEDIKKQGTHADDNDELFSSESDTLSDSYDTSFDSEESDTST